MAAALAGHADRRRGGGLATWALGLHVETIGTRFGGIPSALPAPHLPAFSLAKIAGGAARCARLRPAGRDRIALSAVVADGMTGRRHRSNCELVAQGVANIGCALFGGICVTGTIARTATNVRAGARGPIAGMTHALFLLLFILLAAPLASYIPLAALAGVLAPWSLEHGGEAPVRGPAAQLARRRGCAAGDFRPDRVPRPHRGHRRRLRHRRHPGAASHGADRGHPSRARRSSQRTAPTRAEPRTPYDAEAVSHSNVVVYRLTGAFFFGTASMVNAVLDRIGDQHKAFVLDFAAVPFVDSTAANVIASLARRTARHKVKLYLTGASPAVRRALLVAGVRPPLATYRQRIDDALQEAQAV